MTSPPRYTSNKETSFSRSTFGIGGSSHRNEYEALPLSDEQLSLEEEQRTSIINCKTKGFAIYIKQKDIRDVEHLGKLRKLDFEYLAFPSEELPLSLISSF